MRFDWQTYERQEEGQRMVQKEVQAKQRWSQEVQKELRNVLQQRVLMRGLHLKDEVRHER